MTPNDLEHYKVKSTPYMFVHVLRSRGYELVTSSHKFNSILHYKQPFWSYRSFWDKRKEWSQNDIEHYKVKGTTYMCY